jgi:hypothetical protein
MVPGYRLNDGAAEHFTSLRPEATRLTFHDFCEIFADRAATEEQRAPDWPAQSSSRRSAVNAGDLASTSCVLKMLNIRNDIESMDCQLR